MALETTPFDAADYLESAVAVEAFLIDAFESEDPAVIADAIGIVARSRGMTALGPRLGLSPEAGAGDGLTPAYMKGEPPSLRHRPPARL
jgi:DNA-binding phage protein